MDRTITDRAAANRPMANPTRSTTPIPTKPRSSSSNNTTHRRSNHPRANSSLHPHRPHEPRKADAGTAGEGPRSAARRHQEEAERTQPVNMRRCREEGDEEDSLEEPGDGPETPLPPAGFSRGCRGGGGGEAMSLSRLGRPMERQPAHKPKKSQG